MNTTLKYIFEEKEINPLDFKEETVNNIEIWIESKDRKTKLLTGVYQLNNFGRIEQIKRIDLGWTAYPPVSFTSKGEAKDDGLKIKETFFWNENDQLSNVQVRSNDSSNSYLRKYLYRNNQIIRIEDQFVTYEYYYSDENRLLSFETRLHPAGMLGSVLHKKLTENEIGQITQKVTQLNPSSNSKSIVLMESFKYNEFGQIQKSIQSGEEDGQVHEVLNEFTYLNPSSDKITTISNFTKGSLKNKYTYFYDDQEKLIGVISENDKGQMTRTNYIRK